MSYLIGVPDKILTPWLGNKKYIAPADEGEAIGIACGYYYATGKRATVFMSADGFANALNPLTNLVIPYEIKMNLVISYGRKEPPHEVMSDILEELILLLNVDTKKVSVRLIEKKS